MQDGCHRLKLRYRRARSSRSRQRTEPFARTIDAAKKYVVSSTLEGVGWNAERVRGDLGEAVQRLKREPGRDRPREA
jgi:hypothetical protein